MEFFDGGGEVLGVSGGFVELVLGLLEGGEEGGVLGLEGEELGVRGGELGLEVFVLLGVPGGILFGSRGELEEAGGEVLDLLGFLLEVFFEAPVLLVSLLFLFGEEVLGLDLLLDHSAFLFELFLVFDPEDALVHDLDFYPF